MENRHTFSSWLTALALLLPLWSGHAGSLAAAELIELRVGHEQGIYTVRLAMELNVTANHVQRVLTNYDQLHRLTPSIVESRLLSSPDDEVVRVFTRMKTCVLFFCSGFTRVEDVYRSASGDLLAVIVPGQSDFKAGTARWRITARGDHTLLVYEANMQPDFFIPPLIGSHLVKRALGDELLVSFSRIECCASFRMQPGQNEAGEDSGIC